MNFSNFYKLQIKYEEIFDNIFEEYYNKGYFGNIDKSTIKEVQYKWFCRVVKLIEKDLKDELIPYISNHNNKITREYFSAVSGKNIKNKGKKEIIEIIIGS